MKCPHCGYTHGTDWIDGSYEKVAGEHGGFYSLPIQIERQESRGYGLDGARRDVYGCPSCQKLFWSL